MRPALILALRLAPAFVASAGIAACESVEPARPDVFIALGSDFEGYQDWIVFDRSNDPVPPAHPTIRSVIYANRLPGPGATEFPIGTIFVRTHEDGDDPTQWDVHAMAKRGGGFNAGGARGWEFFGLRFSASRQAFIDWRGEGPGGTSDGYSPDDSGVFLGCNHCHGAVPANDSVLSPVLDLAAFQR